MALRSRSKKSVQPLWRPDFRDVQVLPDTKVIRTGFLVNFVAIAVTLALVILYAFKEYSLQTVTRSLKELEKQVVSYTPENRSILDANKRFKQNAAIVEEVIAFDTEIIDYPLFIREISSILPEGVLLNSLEIETSTATGPAKSKVPPLQVEMRGVIVASSSKTPSQILSDYQATITEISSVEGRGIEMNLDRFQRNNEAGSFNFTLHIIISLNPGAK